MSGMALCVESSEFMQINDPKWHHESRNGFHIRTGCCGIDTAILCGSIRNEMRVKFRGEAKPNHMNELMIEWMKPTELLCGWILVVACGLIENENFQTHFNGTGYGFCAADCGRVRSFPLIEIAHVCSFWFCYFQSISNNWINCCLTRSTRTNTRTSYIKYQMFFARLEKKQLFQFDRMLALHYINFKRNTKNLCSTTPIKNKSKWITSIDHFSIVLAHTHSVENHFTFDFRLS